MTDPTDSVHTPPEGESKATDRGRGQDSGNAPVDKRRIALLNGACGRHNWVLISGQVVDVPVTASQKAEAWDPLLSMPSSQKRRIRPIQDFGMSGVRRARLVLEILKAPPTGAAADLSGAEILYSSEPFTTSDNSFFQIALETDLPPGDYVVRAILVGIDSLRQSVSDLAFIGDSNSFILKKDIPIGYGKLRILSPEYDGYIITSDIDQTFLNTNLDSNRGLVGTMFEEPADKKPLPAMAELYQELMKGPKGPLPLFFISASPHFFRRSLSSVFEQLDISYTGLNLKYLMSTVDNVVRKTFQSIANLDDLFADGISGAVERSMKFLGSSVDSLFDHLSYKMSTLLENRLMQPTQAREILLGDNTESDYFIFTLYQFLITGQLPADTLESYLYHLKFLGREALTRDAARRICDLTARNLERHGKVNSVAGVWINHARANPGLDEMRQMTQAALPEGLDVSSAGGTVPFLLCYGAAGFSLAAHDAGLLTREQLVALWRTLAGQEIRGERITEERLRASLAAYEAQNFSTGEVEQALFGGAG